MKTKKILQEKGDDKKYLIFTFWLCFIMAHIQAHIVLKKNDRKISQPKKIMKNHSRRQK